MTHEYTLLVGATILPGGGRPPCEAVAWAEGTVLALGSDAEVRAISRGDSHVMAYPGAFVVPLGEALDVGGPADLVVLGGDPRSSMGGGPPIAVIRGGHTRREDLVSTDGVRMIPIQTPKGEFRVWTRRIGDNPSARVLLLHGGPGATDEYFEGFEGWFPAAGIEFIYYDQLGSFRSDQPEDPDLWELPRFVEEVEQVRQALGLDAHNFYLLGHSWGGILAMEYALRYGQHLKALVVSNMMSSCPAYNAYARDVLEPAMDPAALAEIKRLEAAGEFEDPRYMELLREQHYVHHVLRMPLEAWPDPVNRAFAHINMPFYVAMQGPSELGLSGRLADWDRTEDLGSITVPTLVIGATHDTMDPAFMEMMAGRFPRGEFLLCPKGSHMAMWDDEQAYFEGLIGFIRRVEAGTR